VSHFDHLTDEWAAGRIWVEDEAMVDEEYQFDYSKAKPNRFAAKLKNGGRLVVLNPEVAAVFAGSEIVNAVLKALLQTMPSKPKRQAEMA
jgi:hypothetical protein